MKKKESARVIVTSDEGTKHLDIFDIAHVPKKLVTGWISYDGIVYPDNVFDVYLNEDKYILVPRGTVYEQMVKTNITAAKNEIRLTELMNGCTPVDAPTKDCPLLENMTIDIGSNTLVPKSVKVKDQPQLTNRDLYVPGLKQYIDSTTILKVTLSSDGKFNIYNIEINCDILDFDDVSISEFKDISLTEYKKIDIIFLKSNTSIFSRLKLQLANRTIEVASKDVSKCKSILAEIDKGTATIGLLNKFMIMTGLQLSVMVEEVKQ